MKDYMIRGIANGGEIRFFAAYSKETVEYARTAHALSPIATAALGRLLTAGVMMGAMMKSESDLLTIKIDCDGPIKGLTVTADCLGHVKGFVANPDVYLPPNDKGKLNVGAALDLGVLSVIRDVGLKDPYIGQTILTTSEIAEDLTYYFATSEQTPSSVALGVLVDKDNTVKTAGGFIVQVMPNAKEETIDALEKRIGEITSVTNLLEKGMMPEDIMNMLFEGMDPVVMKKDPIGFKCSCSREKTEGMIQALPKEELLDMIQDGKEIEVNCHFCNTTYVFTIDELQKMVDKK